MRQFMKNQPGKLPFRVLNESRQHRVAEPSERRVGGHASNLHIVPFATQILGKRLSLYLTEIASVVYASCNREAPLEWLHRQRGRGRGGPRGGRAGRGRGGGGAGGI